MSAQAKEPANRESLARDRFRRRVANGALLVLLGLCALGSRGTWWRILAGEGEDAQVYGDLVESRRAGTVASEQQSDEP